MEWHIRVGETIVCDFVHYCFGGGAYVGGMQVILCVLPSVFTCAGVSVGCVNFIVAVEGVVELSINYLVLAL